mmetsp:Transcript_25828/g.35508  ORF Transcript_25828/g.35508 Transcript_25828/m.35508 type:complete len:103 (+) Transcript_25828:244-552(+)
MNLVYVVGLLPSYKPNSFHDNKSTKVTSAIESRTHCYIIAILLFYTYMHTKLDNEIHGDKTGNPHASAGKHLLAGLPSKAVLSTVGEPAMILQIREEQSANA